MPAALVNLARATDIKDNIPGLDKNVFVAPMDEFATIATWMVHAALGDHVTIDTDHTFTDPLTQGFTTLEGDFKKNTFEGENAGDWGSSNKKWTVKATYHGTGKEVAEIEALLHNTEVMVLTKRLTALGTPVVNQFGLGNMPARCIDAKWVTGTADAGSASVEFTFEAFQPRLAFYEGLISEKP